MCVNSIYVLFIYLYVDLTLKNNKRHFGAKNQDV